MSKSKILFMLSGSIACFKAAQLISRLVQDNFDVQPVVSDGALQFIGEATLEGLTGKKVFKNIYEPGQMMGHIELAKWADLSIVCPATAQTINGLAHGTAADPIGSLFLATELRRPFLIAPAMNQAMFNHPSVQTSLTILETWKVRILKPDFGHQACGDIGLGRLQEPESLLQSIKGELGL